MNQDQKFVLFVTACGVLVLLVLVALLSARIAALEAALTAGGR